MPRRNRERPSRKKRAERIERQKPWEPFGGDRELIIAEIKRRLQRHIDCTGLEELIRRIRARGLEPPPAALALLAEEKLKGKGDDVSGLLPVPHGCKPLPSPHG